MFFSLVCDLAQIVFFLQFVIVYHCFVIANIILADKCLFLFIFEAASIEQNDTTWAKKKVLGAVYKLYRCLLFIFCSVWVCKFVHVDDVDDDDKGYDGNDDCHDDGHDNEDDDKKGRKSWTAVCRKERMTPSRIIQKVCPRASPKF